ncbi:hypothetical protein EGR_07976 [Echinococcus granulosus]|uniref:Uncharacterized protein n=1 Tax=Echinococcus granulosus TaxID=6210 RepID=W6UUT0_ECHGR|nr:hypothetical protein EGR_07976 [Echinococcus granulosus]EUB57159.1 hypothetical protein EGR_07976 [Echinococcus granulosus]
MSVLLLLLLLQLAIPPSLATSAMDEALSVEKRDPPTIPVFLQQTYKTVSEIGLDWETYPYDHEFTKRMFIEGAPSRKEVGIVVSLSLAFILLRHFSEPRLRVGLDEMITPPVLLDATWSRGQRESRGQMLIGGFEVCCSGYSSMLRGSDPHRGAFTDEMHITLTSLMSPLFTHSLPVIWYSRVNDTLPPFECLHAAWLRVTTFSLWGSRITSTRQHLRAGL